MEMFDQYAFWLFVAVAVLSVLLILLVVAKVKLVSEHIWVWAIFMWFCLQCSSLYMGFLTFNKFFDFTQFTAREAFFISLLLGIPILICENIKRRREK